MKNTPMLIILSPAKKLNIEPDVATYSQLTDNQLSQPELLDHAQRLVKQLKRYSASELKQLMGISNALSELNKQRYEQWQLPFSTDNAKPAIHMFQGDVYAGLNAKTLDTEGLLFSNHHVRILSGLYGLLKPLDLIQPYRLEMGTALATERGKDLYQFWGQLLTNQLNQVLSHQKAPFLINLASDEYYKSIQPKNIQANIIKPVFKDKKNGTYKVVSFYAKKARGLMTRFIIDQQLQTAEQLKDFNVAGYHYNESLSAAHDWIFTREEPAK